MPLLTNLIGYYYWPKEVLDLVINDERVSCIRGNHEEILAQIIVDEEKAYFFRSKYGSGYDSCFSELSSTEIDWLINLPKSLELEIQRTTFLLSHGGLGSVNKYIYPDAEHKDLEKHYSNMDFTMFGNTHYSFIHHFDGKHLLNPGSVGQPRDTSGLSSYVIIDLNNLVLKFKRILFDVDEIIKEAKHKDPSINYLWDVLIK